VGLGEGWFVSFIMTMSTKTNKTDNNIFFEAFAVLKS